MGIVVGVVLAYVMLSQNHITAQPYRYEIERDAEGRMSGLAYIPIPIGTIALKHSNVCVDQEAMLS